MDKKTPPRKVLRRESDFHSQVAVGYSCPYSFCSSLSTICRKASAACKPRSLPRRVPTLASSHLGPNRGSGCYAPEGSNLACQCFANVDVGVGLVRSMDKNVATACGSRPSLNSSGKPARPAEGNTASRQHPPDAVVGMVHVAVAVKADRRISQITASGLNFRIRRVSPGGE